MCLKGLILILFLICSWILVWVLHTILQKVRWRLIEMIYFPDFLWAQNPQQITRDIRLFFSSRTHKFTDKYNIQCFCYPMIQDDPSWLFPPNTCVKLWAGTCLCLSSHLKKLPCSRSKGIRAERYMVLSTSVCWTLATKRRVGIS